MTKCSDIYLSNMTENNKAFFSIMEMENCDVGDGFYFPTYMRLKQDENEEKIRQKAANPMAFLTVCVVGRQVLVSAPE